MQIEEAVQSILTADSALVARVPADRIRTSGENIDLQQPYIVHGAARENIRAYHNGAPSLRIIEYSVSAFASDLDDAYEISELVLSALNGTHSSGLTMVCSGRRRTYDFDARLWEAELTFTAGIAP